MESESLGYGLLTKTPVGKGLENESSTKTMESESLGDGPLTKTVITKCF